MQRAASTFVGRAEELRKITELFESGHRLVTVWGAGGMGKTRLGLELAKAAPERSLFVDLSETTSAEGLCAELATSLGILVGQARATADLLAQVGRALRARREILVVFDNFEQLVATASETLAALMDAAPGAHFLVTSRERVRIAGEIAFELPPLSLPEELGLFTSRAGALGAAEAFDPSDERLARLLRQLEGIPLAIELAAARVEVLGIEGLLTHLPSRLDLLSRGARDAPARHATMRAAIAWSWDLLDEPQQNLLRQLAVFRGGFTLEAAQKVVEASDVADHIASLRDKSLLQTRRGGGPPRFQLFESVREFAQEKSCDRASHARLRRRHDAYFVELGKSCAALVDSSGDLEARARLDREVDNLLDVHARALAERPASAEAAARGASALLAADASLAIRASSAMRRSLWEGTAEAVEAADVESALLAEVLGALGRTLHAAGESVRAQQSLERALATALAAARGNLEAPLALDLGIVVHARGDHAAARSAYDRALAACERAGSPRSEARALGNLAALDHDQGNFTAARELYERSIRVAARLGDIRVEGIMTTNLGVLEQEEGRLERALDHFGRAITLLERTGDLRLLTIARGNRGMLYAEQGALDRARDEHQRALDALRAIGDAHSVGLALTRLAMTLALTGNAERAVEHVHEAKSAFLRVNDEMGLCILDVASAALDLAAGTPEALARARETLADAAPFAEISDDARTFVRILSNAADRIERGATAEADPSPEALVVGPDCAHYREPRGTWRSLGDHRAAHRVLRRLVGEREARPGVGLSVDALVAAGWPDQRILPQAAANRLYVVIAWLRKRGLGELLRRTEAGYALDPSVPLQRVSRAPS